MLLTLGPVSAARPIVGFPAVLKSLSHNYRRFHKGKRQLIPRAQAPLRLPFRIFPRPFPYPSGLASIRSCSLSAVRRPNADPVPCFSSNTSASVKGRFLKLSQIAHLPRMIYSTGKSALSLRKSHRPRYDPETGDPQTFLPGIEVGFAGSEDRLREVGSAWSLDSPPLYRENHVTSSSANARIKARVQALTQAAMWTTSHSRSAVCAIRGSWEISK